MKKVTAGRDALGEFAPKFAELSVTGLETAAVSLAVFYRLACAYFCKATALLQISRFAFRKKAAERNSLTSQINNFL